MRLHGATAVTSDHEQADEVFARKITIEMQATATVLLSTNPAGTVNATMPSIHATTARRRPSTGEVVRRVTRSDAQPANNAPAKPHGKGIEAAMPARAKPM